MDVTLGRMRTKSAAIWGISAVLSIVFLVSGAQKLIGDSSFFAVAAMDQYPAWFRQVVGLVEILGAIGLLIPRMTLLSAFALSTVMFGAAYTHLVGGIPGAALPAFLFVLLLVVIWAKRPETV